MRGVMVVACVLTALTVRNASASVTVVPNLAIFVGRVTACPAGRTSEPGATTAGACVCERGRRGTGCALCGADSFKAELGAAACGSCGSNMRSLPGSASRDECLCRDGFTAAVSGCWACVSGSYKSYVGNASCVACPQHSSQLASVPLRDGMGTCLCNAGFTGATTKVGGCEQCGTGFYKIGLGDVRCELCPAHSVAVAGSTLIENCLCGPGFTGTVTATGRCAQCPAGTFKETLGPVESTSSCVISGTVFGTAIGTGMEFAAIVHSHTSIPGLLIFIIRQGPHYKMQGVTIENAKRSTTPTTTDKFLSSANNIVLDATTASRMWDGTLAGYTTISFANYNLKNVQVNCCTTCPANSNSPVQSTAATACQCNAGFSGPDGGACVVCPAGSYCGVGVADGVCMANSTSPAGSDEAQDCVCLPGFWQDTVCNECTPGSYCPGDKLQVPCPLDSTSPRLSTSEDDCTCDSGYMPVGT